ncbi:hypothetical protein DB32_005371 [Sandaracinus amylolyticus]|uniref:Fibronectin type-III domain-containing protein n=1 Tax=Sandaracinus amylolyticus TaxID=927083 RepID=A0A0F6YLD6_9BACT|nr:hypothetical protein DB32_005371 [Sandaracinus amylolyticus]
MFVAVQHAAPFRGLAVALALVGAPGAALAQDDPCVDDTSPARRPVEVTPSVGAFNVTLDAPIAVRYSRGYFGPDGPGDDPATLLRIVRCPADVECSAGCSAADGEDVAGRVQVIGDQLFFFPDGGFEPSRAYAGRAGGIDESLDFRFCTGVTVDNGPPVLGEFLDAEPSESTAECVLPEGGRLVGLRWEQATDDGPPGSIEYMLYLTRAAGVNAPQLRDRVRNYASREITLNLRLDALEASEPVCVRVFAADGVGNVSEPSDERCFDPLTDAAFQPLCAVSAPGSARAMPWALAGFALVLGVIVARRRAR